MKSLRLMNEDPEAFSMELTAKASETRVSKGNSMKFIFQPLILRGKVLVSGRVLTFPTPCCVCFLSVCFGQSLGAP